MKKKIIALLALSTLALSASAQIKIATVSIAKCLENYYRTAEVNEKIRSSLESLQAEAQRRQEELRAEFEPLQAQIDEIRENPGLSDQAKQEQIAALQPRIQAFRTKETEFQQWGQQRQQEAEATAQSHNRNLIKEIKDVVVSIGITEGNQLVLDTSDVLSNGIPPVLYSAPAIDITNKVINELNKDRPAE